MTNITFDHIIYALVALNAADAVVTYYVLKNRDAEEANVGLAKIMDKIGNGPALLLKILAVAVAGYFYLGKEVSDLTYYSGVVAVVAYVGVLIWNVRLYRRIK